MSSKPNRGNVFRLDASGNIDADRLSKELTDALAFDIDYRQKDNMKKRAVRIAPDYDAFKNMVACAGLKKVSRQEVESLGDAKKGWKKVGDGSKGATGASILGTEVLESAKKKSAGIVLLGGRLKKPKNSSEFNRDWRRVKTTDDKIRYLAMVGEGNAAKFFASMGDTEFFEHVLAFLSGLTGDPLRCLDGGSVVKVWSEGDKDVENDGVGGGGELGEKEMDVCLDILNWLEKLTSIEKFDFARQFMDPKLSSDITTWLQQLSLATGTREDNISVSGGGAEAEVEAVTHPAESGTRDQDMIAGLISRFTGK